MTKTRNVQDQSLSRPPLFPLKIFNAFILTRYAAPIVPLPSTYQQKAAPRSPRMSQDDLYWSDEGFSQTSSAETTESE